MTVRGITLSVLSFVATMLLIVGAGLMWVVYSDEGSRWSVEFITDLAGDELELQNVSGSWNAGLMVEDGSFTNATSEITFSDIFLKLDIRYLLLRQLRIATLRIGEVNYRPIEDTTEPDEEFYLSLPVRLTIADAEVSRFAFQADTTEVAENIRLALTWADTDLEIERLALTARDTQVTGTVELDLQGDIDLAAAIDWQQAAAEGQPLDQKLQGRGRVTGDTTRLSVEHELLAPYPVLTQGSVQLGETPSIDLVNTSEQIVYAAEGLEIQVNNVDARLEGWLDNYLFTAEATLVADSYPLTVVSGNGTGNTDGVQIDEFVVEAGDSEISATGPVTWADTIQWQLNIKVLDVDPALIAAEWPGDIDGTLALAGTWAENDLRYQVDALNLKGSVRDQPVTAQGGLRQADNVLAINQLKLGSGSNRLTLNGSYGQRMNLSYQADLRNLAELGPDWSGRATGNGRVSGTLEQPSLTISLNGSELSVPGYAIEQLSITGNLASVGPGGGVEIEALSVAIGEQKLDRVVANLQGQLPDHRIAVTVESNVENSADNNVVNGDVLVSGGWDGVQWAGQLLSSNFALAQLDRWEQTGAANVTASATQVEFGELCWQSTNGSACIAGVLSETRLAATGRLQNILLDVVASQLPSGVTVDGKTNITFDISGTPAQPVASFSANADDFEIRYLASEEEGVVSTMVRDLDLVGNLNPDNLQINLQVAGINESGQLNFQGEFPGWSDIDSARINATLTASIPDIGFVSLLSPELTETTGEITADLALTGRLMNPTPAGYLRLGDGKARVLAGGIDLTDVTMELQPAGANGLALLAGAQSGEGRLELDGTVTLDPDKSWPVDATLRGENFTALKTAEVLAVVSPDLDIAGNATDLKITGKVLAPKVTVELEELPEQAVKVSPDAVVYRGDDAEPMRPSLIKIQTELEVDLGDDVSFSGFGLTSQLDGQLVVRTTTGRPSTGNGVVRITSGEFSAYGQDLEIQNGRLVFTGPLDDPALFVDATRNIDGVRVGVRISGTGQAPEAIIFSRPAMSEANALSYLVTGRPLSDASGSDGAEIRNAALALGLKQAIPVTDEISRVVGLDELGLDADDTSGGSVMAGKRITRDLYVRYSYGLFNSIGSLLLRYRLNDRLNLEARSADDQSMDLIYTRERP